VPLVLLPCAPRGQSSSASAARPAHDTNVPLAQLTGIALAVGAAVAWGGSDFTGGYASRRAGPLHVLVLSRLAGLVCYATLAIVSGEAAPPPASMAWAAMAGCAGALGIAALYAGLTTGRAAVVVPTSGVIGAAMPVAFAAVVAGVLPVFRQLGLLTALVGIFLVSVGQGSRAARWSGGLGFGVLAGIGFGVFFICLGLVEPGHVFAPLAVAGVASFVAAGALLLSTRASLPSPTSNPSALLAGVFDATGAVCYVLALHWVRLDVAAVLSSLYPAVTVLLFRVVAREAVSRAQWVGLAICVAAIALIVV
jgi:drug/metabolite transporter (DMT)-like permease